MHRMDQPVAGAWQALVCDVAAPRRPGLRVRVAGAGRLLLEQAGSPVLFAVVAADHGGVDYVRTGRFVGPVPPVRAAQARSVGPLATVSARHAGTDDGGWHARWAHRFATALDATPLGPLHDGRWVISRPATDPAVTPLSDDRGVVDWFAVRDPGQVLPLRRLAAVGDPRVRAYRKQVRDGTLAPVLLWWISGLDCYVLLDGHDRLVAAHAEGRQPPVLALSLASAWRADVETEAALRHYEATTERMRPLVEAGTAGAADAVVAVNRRYAAQLATIRSGHAPTRAWPLPGGSRRWSELARGYAVSSS
ncbi:hypothetical protein O7623_14900 [Solwaraspora sp. WMMD791]|uniref:hypothetical protein n=1 Tax=Solwaraspora sp. WMMD791 TaxID=3016086 RepID=UPI00249B8460|nr:hypothetical protein [Solwaraspora sp. WMMD791]WFE30389.1 hypothetical protein O7623_14900 [Solwaraspora sp. WMMD791]